MPDKSAVDAVALVGTAANVAMLGSGLYGAGQAAGVWGQAVVQNAALQKKQQHAVALSAGLPTPAVESLQRPFASAGASHFYVGPEAWKAMTTHTAALALVAGVDRVCKEAGFDAEDRTELLRLVKQAARFAVPKFGPVVGRNGQHLDPVM